jgi:regulatory protein
VPDSARKRPFTAKSPQELESALRERCLKLLAQQPRTRAELERSLGRAGAPDEMVGEVLDRLTGVGLIDDVAYAQAYVRTGIAVRRRGTRSLRAELRGRGVAPEVIEMAAAKVDDEAERATALALATRRAAGLSRLAPDARRRRVTALLLRRGFSGALVSSVLAEVLAAAGDEYESGGGSVDGGGQIGSLGESADGADAFSDG